MRGETITDCNPHYQHYAFPDTLGEPEKKQSIHLLQTNASRTRSVAGH